MIGTCRLCEQQTKLKESHFIPKFVGKWLKKTLITGFFREHNELEKRAQDTAKEYWLCGQCEGLLSNWERGMALDVVGNSTDLYIYTKIPSFIILGVVKAKQLNQLRASRVALKEGKLSPRAYRWPDGFHSYVFEKAEEMILAHQQIPEKDLKKFEDFIAEHPEKTANSKQFKALMHDYQRFGAKIFR